MSITGTLIIQMIVFLILVGFTMKYIWPPLVKALDERAAKISHGLAAAEHAKIELSNVHREVETKLAATRSESAAVLADAARRAQHIIDEAKAVRARAGVFDLGHMGRVRVRGRDATAMLQYVQCNDASAIAPGQIRYSMFLNENGRVLDDILVYGDLDGDGFFLVVNAG